MIVKRASIEQISNGWIVDDGIVKTYCRNKAQATYNLFLSLGVPDNIILYYDDKVFFKEEAADDGRNADEKK